MSFSYLVLLMYDVTLSDSYSAATLFGGVTYWYLERSYREPAVMSSSTFTYRSVYTDSEPWRFYRGSDEEPSNVGSPGVIVYGYDGLPMHPVAPLSPNYVPGPEYPPSPDYVPGPEHPPSPVYVLEPEYL
ncbi:hypothetical protein Tco_1025779, partial [Tanacetum coccineum]